MSHCRVLQPGEFNGMSSQSHVSHCGVLPLGEFTVMIPDPHATLQGAITWQNQCHDRAHARFFASAVAPGSCRPAGPASYCPFPFSALHFPSLFSLSFLPSPPVTSFPLLSPPLPPLKSRLLKSTYGVWGIAVSFPSGVCGGAPAKIEFGAF